MPGCWCTIATVSAGAEEEEAVSCPLLERAGEEREEGDFEGKIRPGLGVLSVRMLKSEPSVVAAFFGALVGV